VSVFEVVRGRHQANQPERAAQFLQWAQSAEVLGFDTECAQLAGEMAGALVRDGLGVGVADVLIAATAVTHGLTLATANEDHYRRMERFGLRIENWRLPL
jgi:predicted nucleic acid-binding protein